jgi:uncharacterized protein with FMN-binding domain
MQYTRAVRKAAVCAILIVLSFSFAACAVNKAELSRRIDLRDVDVSKVPDGAYPASYTIDPPPPVVAANKTVSVRVTISGGRYAAIEILQPPKLGDSAVYKTLVARIQETQRLSIDAVSGATITSAAVLKAIQKAVSSPGE